MARIFRLAYDAVVSMRQKRALDRVLRNLDERTLRDIGLESEANRARDRARFAVRFGGF